ncbi:2S seed storage albumin protein-like [Henckelia pumila]|uniref:2S seed storage albumin protein-like n=1 Tax=Henckelia pumila TaxID=405737 RepID=UPI003C6E1A4F
MASWFLRTVTFLVLLATPMVTFAVDKGGEWSAGCGQRIEIQSLSSCRQYLIDSSRFVPENHHHEGSSSWREEFPRCCDELERINEQCRCEAIQKVCDEGETGELLGREMREMKLTAQSLPGLCRISPQYCGIDTF